MFNDNVCGVDLGTSTVKLYSQRNSHILTEKTMVAIRNRTQVIADGNDAFEMYEKTPPDISVDRPVINGSIADVDEVEILLRILLHRADPNLGKAPAICFSAPVNMPELEKRAYYAIGHTRALGNTRVYLVDRPVCDAIALGIPLSRTKGTMIVNMGARNTDLSILANDQVIISRSIPIGGQNLNEAIQSEIRRKNNLLIGKRTARRLKAVLATFEGDLREARRVTGVHTLSGLPRESIVSSALVSDAVEREVGELAEQIRTFLERTPPQIGKCIMDEGVYLTGGTSRIPGIDQFLTSRLGCRVNLSPHYEMNTILGIRELITHRDLQKWAYSIRKKR